MVGVALQELLTAPNINTGEGEVLESPTTAETKTNPRASIVEAPVTFEQFEGLLRMGAAAFNTQRFKE